MPNKIEVFQQDALAFLHEQDHGSIHVIVTDPPYWTLDKWRKIGTTTRLGGGRNKDEQRPDMFFETIDKEYLWDFVRECGRVLSADGHMYLFCDDIVAPIVLNYIRESGETGFEEAHMLVWDKMNMGMGYHYRLRYECIIFAWKKGKRRLRDLGKSDVFQYKRVVNGYPTEKPSALYGELVTQSLRERETVCDPFAGRGTLAFAVPFVYNVNILLNDNSPRSQEEIKRRFSQCVLVPEGELSVRYHEPLRIVSSSAGTLIAGGAQG